jgi:hypothetical protein
MVKAAEMNDPKEPLSAASRRHDLEDDANAAVFQLMVDLGPDSEPTKKALEQVQAIANLVVDRAFLGPADGSLFWGGREGSRPRLQPENVDAWLARATHFVVVAKPVGDRLQIEITSVGPTTMEEPGRGRPN